MQDSRVTCSRCGDLIEASETFHTTEVLKFRNYTPDSADRYIRSFTSVAFCNDDEAFARRVNELLSYCEGYSEEVVVCDDCINICESCGEAYAKPIIEDNAYSGDEERWRMSRLGWNNMENFCRSCGDNASQCDRCEEWVHIEDTYTIDDDFCWCVSCRDDYSEYCEDCEMDYRIGTHRCRNGRSNGRINYYSYKPEPRFRWNVELDGDLSDYRTRQATPFLGIEVELELRDADQSDALDIVEDMLGDWAYCKEDGSIDDGFEIVTHPMTLAAYQTMINWSFATKLADLGCRSWNTSTCGIHVHISRSAFTSPRHVAMFQHLIINNEVEMSRLAGRSHCGYARFEGIRPNIQKRLKKYPSAWADRYEAVNTTPDTTIEVRMFRGSLKPERILMALELVDAAFHYTKTMNTRNYKDTDRAHFWFFARWVDGQAKYANLNHFINHYNLTANLPASLADVVLESN